MLVLQRKENNVQVVHLEVLEYLISKGTGTLGFPFIFETGWKCKVSILLY